MVLIHIFYFPIKIVLIWQSKSNNEIVFLTVDLIDEKLIVEESQDNKNILSFWDFSDQRKVFLTDIPTGTVHLEVKAFRVVHFLNKTDRRRRQNLEDRSTDESTTSRTVFETVAEFYDFWSPD